MLDKFLLKVLFSSHLFIFLSPAHAIEMDEKKEDGKLVLTNIKLLDSLDTKTIQTHEGEFSVTLKKHPYLLEKESLCNKQSVLSPLEKPYKKFSTKKKENTLVLSVYIPTIYLNQPFNPNEPYGIIYVPYQMVLEPRLNATKS